MASPTDVTTAAAADDPDTGPRAIPALRAPRPAPPPPPARAPAEARDTGLRAIRALRDLADRLEALQVRNARARGWSWQQIADALGVTRQAVHKKHATSRRDR